MSKTALLRIIIGIAILGLGFGGGIAFQRAQRAACDTTYRFINRDIACGAPDTIRKTGYIETVNYLKAYIAAVQATGEVSEVSVYFRDLVHGPVFGINELADFAPASLLKLPLAMVFFRSAETEPEVLTHSVKYEGNTAVMEQRIRPRISAEEGTPYTIEELLRMMLVYSDNASYEALEAFLAANSDRSFLRHEIFQEIGLINSTNRVEETITVRGYASLFRILYNVSYLEREYSERILKWLSESEYDKGLVAGVPEGISVAHKFGERVVSGGLKQLHDCGIVYYPGNPYLLCVMTRGKDFTELEHVIMEISRMTYQEVGSRRL
jgi:beta-lactamase class A